MHAFHAGRTRARNLAAPAARTVAPAPKVRSQTAEIRHILGRSAVQPKLEIGAANDALEREADQIADQVMRMPASADAAPATPPVARSGAGGVRRLCAECEEEHPVGATLRRQSADDKDQPARTEEGPGTTPIPTTSFEIAILGLRGGGAPLPSSERAFFEPRFGRSFEQVRIHTGAKVDHAAKSINARAFTLGNDVALASTDYVPGSTEGRRLMAHELTHTLQQGGGGQAAAAGLAADRSPIVRRVTHGSSTPTNCHNWKIPLPPWIAGSLAHLQAAHYFAQNPGSAGRILPEVTMPRGTKLLMGMANPPEITPPGFMDLIGVTTGIAQIGEIKSTASAALATPQATHYLTRHAEWLSRAPFTGATWPAANAIDLAYQTVLGGLPAGALMSGLAAVTGTGVDVGPFMGDPLKRLWVEADAAGAIVYWCTGVGTTNPAWAEAFRRAFRKVIDAFWDAYRAIVEVIEDVGDWIWDHPVLAFFILLVLLVIGVILAIIGGILEIPSFGGSTPVTAGGVALALAAGVALLALLGLDTDDMEDAGSDIVAAMQPMGGASGADYERDADQGDWASADVDAEREGLSDALTTFSAAIADLPEQLSDRTLAALNPFSQGPSLPSVEDVRSTVTNTADMLAQNSDSKIAGIGRYVKSKAELV